MLLLPGCRAWGTTLEGSAWQRNRDTASVQSVYIDGVAVTWSVLVKPARIGGRATVVSYGTFVGYLSSTCLGITESPREWT